ncbi:hypothetical protein ACWD6O_02960 [Streptomyces californicus]
MVEPLLETRRRLRARVLVGRHVFGTALEGPDDVVGEFTADVEGELGPATAFGRGHGVYALLPHGVVGEAEGVEGRSCVQQVDAGFDAGSCLLGPPKILPGFRLAPVEPGRRVGDALPGSLDPSR